MGVLSDARTQHDYRRCRDEDCQRYACRIWREAYPAGHAAGEAKGYTKGHADGYSEGYSEGWAEGYAAGAASASKGG